MIRLQTSVFSYGAFLFLISVKTSAGCLPEDIIRNSYIVELKKTHSIHEAQEKSNAVVSELKAQGFGVKTVFDSSKGLKTAFNPQQILDLPPTTLTVQTLSPEQKSTLESNPEIETVSENCRNYLMATVNDPQYSKQWALQKIQAEEAWDIGVGDVKTVISISDTGVDYLHEDLVDNMWINEKEKNGLPNVDDDSNGFIDDIHGADPADGDGDPMGGNQATLHGTHVAGIAGAVGNNGKGVTGISQKVKIIAAKGFRDGGAGDEDALIRTIYYSIENGARVVNCSWGRQGTATPAMVSAFNYAKQKGVIIVVAAGNSTRDTSGFTPANVNGAVAIAATDRNDQIAQFSNYGTRIDLAAPGGKGFDSAGQKLDGIFATLPRAVGSYGDLIGTSMAAPYVTGLAALVISVVPSLTPELVLKALKDGADDISVRTPNGLSFNYKRINALKALKAAQELGGTTGGPENPGGEPTPPRCRPGDLNCQSDDNSGEVPSSLRNAFSADGMTSCGMVSSINSSNGGFGGGSGSAVALVLIPAFLTLFLRRKKLTRLAAS